MNNKILQEKQRIKVINSKIGGNIETYDVDSDNLIINFWENCCYRDSCEIYEINGYLVVRSYRESWNPVHTHIYSSVDELLTDINNNFKLGPGIIKYVRQRMIDSNDSRDRRERTDIHGYSVSCDKCNSEKEEEEELMSSNYRYANRGIRRGGYSLKPLTNCVFCEKPFVSISVTIPGHGGCNKYRIPSYNEKGILRKEFKARMTGPYSFGGIGPNTNEYKTMLEIDKKRLYGPYERNLNYLLESRK